MIEGLPRPSLVSTTRRFAFIPGSDAPPAFQLGGRELRVLSARLGRSRLIDEMHAEGLATRVSDHLGGRQRSSDRIGVIVGAGLMTLLSVPYLLALASPLRLSWDAVVYLSLARESVTGEPYEPTMTTRTAIPNS